MFSLDVRKIFLVTIATAAISCLAAPQRLAAASPDAKAYITYTAKGTFAATPVSGDDQLKLAGQKFVINVVANSSMKPTKHGPNWAEFDGLKMQGTVFSSMLPNKPQPISSNWAILVQTVAASEDILQAGFPIRVISIRLNAIAHITMPAGTLLNDLIRPFSSVALDSTNATITYKNVSASTVLAVESGTLVATLPAGAAAAEAAPSALVLLDGAQAVKPRVIPTIWE